MNNGNLTKREIVLSIYEENDYQQKDVKDIVQKTLDCVFDALASGRNIELRSFGVFELQVRKPRPGRNPKKPEDVVTIPERIAVYNSFFTSISNTILLMFQLFRFGASWFFYFLWLQ